jgi:hypothetical protein
MDSSLHRFASHDWNTATWFEEAQGETVAQLEQNLTVLDAEARMLAVLFLIKKGDSAASSLLLRMTGDDDGQVAAMAAQGVNSVAEWPSVDAVIEAIPRRRYPLVRSQLYLAIARTENRDALPRIRSLMQFESDDEVLLHAEVAAILLGGEEERAEFIDRLHGAKPADALELEEKLELIGDARLARGLLPWLPNQRPVTRFGSDANQRMLRMCDLAVWAAHRLGIWFPMTSESLTNFDAETLAAAQMALAAIDDHR